MDRDFPITTAVQDAYSITPSLPTPAHSLEKVNSEEMVTDVSGTERQLTVLVSLLSSCDTKFTILYHLWGEEGGRRGGDRVISETTYKHGKALQSTAKKSVGILKAVKFVVHIYTPHNPVHSNMKQQYMAYLITVITDADHAHPLSRKGFSHHLQ